MVRRLKKRSYRGRSYSQRSRISNKKTLFFPARHEKYAEIVRIDTPENARKSFRKLRKEFLSAKTRDKKIRIKRVVVLTINRIDAMRKRKNLSTKEYRELGKVKKIYQGLLKYIDKRL